MSQATFDELDYFEKLKDVGFSDAQARVHANVMRKQFEAQNAIISAAIEKYDQTKREDLSTKGDLRETELQLKNEIKATELCLQKDIREIELRLEQVRSEIQKTKYDLLKWQIGGWVALAAIMAKGFNWVGF